MADSKKYNGSTWEHSLRKLATATDTFTTLPVDVYADGNNATVGISGNTVQNGTPTPDNPIMPQGCGNMTANLFDGTKIEAGRINNETGIVEYASGTSALSFADETVTISTSVVWRGFVTDFINAQEYLRRSYVSDTAIYGYEYAYDVNKEFLGSVSLSEVPTGTKYIRISFQLETAVTNAKIKNMMLNTGSTPLPYEPYGQYKIPILSAGQTTPVYLGEVETTRKVKKLVLTGKEDWFANWRPATGTYATMLIDDTKKIQNILLCTHLEFQNYDRLYYGTVGISTVFNDKYLIAIRVPDTVASNDTELKAYLAQQYANGTPVVVWYVLAEPTTGIVNEPLMRIGKYADTVSGITIPTVTGADSFDVLTALKPSEASLNYTGWHDATVQEWDGSQWNQ